MYSLKRDAADHRAFDVCFALSGGAKVDIAVKGLFMALEVERRFRLLAYCH